MEAGIVDTINRRDVSVITCYLDAIDAEFPDAPPWYLAPFSETLMAENATSNSDRAWLVGILAAGTRHVAFDGNPADGDWDNLFSHFRAEILARRDPKTPPARTAETLPGSVV